MDNNKREVQFTQLICQEFKTPNGLTLYNLYGLGEDGAVYKKIAPTPEKQSRGWIKLNMIVEYEENGE